LSDRVEIILIGLGVITFNGLKANWQRSCHEAKVTLLLSLFIGVNIALVLFVEAIRRAQQRLGHGLLILGALMILGRMYG